MTALLCLGTETIEYVPLGETWPEFVRSLVAGWFRLAYVVDDVGVYFWIGGK